MCHEFHMVKTLSLQQHAAAAQETSWQILLQNGFLYQKTFFMPVSLNKEYYWVLKTNLYFETCLADKPENMIYSFKEKSEIFYIKGTQFQH